jgi:hypothetical protein
VSAAETLSIDVILLDGKLLQALLFRSWITPDGCPCVRQVAVVTEGTAAQAKRYLRARAREIFGRNVEPKICTSHLGGLRL